MDSQRFCEISELLRRSETVNDHKAGSNLNWDDIFFAIKNVGGKVSNEIRIAIGELEEWMEEARVNHAHNYPFTEELV